MYRVSGEYPAIYGWDLGDIHKSENLDKQTVNSAAALKNLIHLYVDKFIDSHDGRLKLFFIDEWKENFTHHSYGHEIESAWLLHEAATVYSHINLIQKARELSVRIFDRVLERGCLQ